MRIKMAAGRVLFPLLVLLTMANCWLVIDFKRTGNTLDLRCSEMSQEGIPNVLTDPNLFHCNTSLVVTTFLDTMGITFVFETGYLKFEVQQDVEGYYFCARDEDISSKLTILAHPSRNSVPTSYEVQVGEPVILRNGVGEGTLPDHYHAQWYKNFLPLAEANIIRGYDLSLLISSAQLSDSGTYNSDVTVVNDGGFIEHQVKPEILIKLVVYKIPRVERPPTPIVMVQENGGTESVSFDCIATGEPQLQVSWFKNGYENLTADYSSRYDIDEKNRTRDESGTSKVESRLTINDVTHLNSGVYGCVATILGRQSDEFTTQGNGTLTVLDSHFNLKTVITENQQLQLWVELEVPLPDTVRATVCFTSLDSGIQRHRTTSSALINSTILIFQLEPSDIPDDFQEGDFRVQVALQVGLTKGPLVPSNLEEADIANLAKPTGNDCKESDKYKIPVITAGSVVGAVLVVFVLSFCCYKTIIRVKKLNRLSSSDIKELIKNNEELLNKMKETMKDPDISKEHKKDLLKQMKKTHKHTEGVINGDCASSDNNSTDVP